MSDALRAHRGRPHPLRLLAEGVRATRAQPVATVIGVLVVAVVCVVVLLTTGRSAALERQVVDRIDATGTRLVAVQDSSGGAGMATGTVDAVVRADVVASAFALGPVTDVRNAATGRLGPVVPLRPVYGDVLAHLPLVAGRAPGPGEAVAGRAAAGVLGLQTAAGTVDDAGRAWPVVGIVAGEGPLAELDNGLLAVTEDAAVPARVVYVLAGDAAQVDHVGETVVAVAVAHDARQLVVEIPSGALALRQVVAGDLGAASRQLMAVVLAVGLVLVTTTTFGAVAARRRDFGRRRALGASRSALVVLVLTQTLAAALVGVLVGLAAGLVAVHLVVGVLPTPAFVVGVGTLTVLVATVGAVPPAVLAARRDPVRILRVP